MGGAQKGTREQMVEIITFTGSGTLRIELLMITAIRATSPPPSGLRIRSENLRSIDPLVAVRFD